MMSKLKIRDALPELFQKTFPLLDPKTKTLPALSLLEFHDIDALPLSFDAEKKHRAVAGFSCLARLMQLDRNELPKFLEQPCEKVSEPLSSVGADSRLSFLLDKFLQTRFGFVRVEDRKKVGTLVGLWDLLGLYETGELETGLTVEDVASPIFSMPQETSTRRALKAMFDKRCRRIFIDGTVRFVWDRGIIERLFSPGALKKAVENPSKDILGMPLSEFRMIRAEEVESGTTLKEAARMLRMERGQCLVFDGMVATPWDVVMKPWEAKALKIR
jgi:hypothetical protein